MNHPFAGVMVSERSDGAQFAITDPELVDLDGGGQVPRQVTYRQAGDGERPGREIVFEVRDGVPVCTRLTLISDDETGISATDLRAIRLHEMATEAVTWFGVKRPNPNGSGHVWVMGRGARSGDRLQVEKAAARRKITPEFLRRVLDVHRSAPEGGKLAAVMQEFNVEERQALRYIKRATDMAKKQGETT